MTASLKRGIAHALTTTAAGYHRTARLIRFTLTLFVDSVHCVEYSWVAPTPHDVRSHCVPHCVCISHIRSDSAL